eukprot:92794-Rhodomonas_salina.1
MGRTISVAHPSPGEEGEEEGRREERGGRETKEGGEEGGRRERKEGGRRREEKGRGASVSKLHGEGGRERARGEVRNNAGTERYRLGLKRNRL